VVNTDLFLALVLAYRFCKLRGIAFYATFTACSKACQGPVYAFQGPWQDADVEMVDAILDAYPHARKATRFARTTTSPQPYVKVTFSPRSVGVGATKTRALYDLCRINGFVLVCALSTESDATVPEFELGGPLPSASNHDNALDVLCSLHRTLRC